MLIESGEVLKNIKYSGLYNPEKVNNLFIDNSEIEEILTNNLLSVTDKIEPTEIENYKTINDYISYAPYWWPNPNTSNGLPYIKKDGVWRKECILYSEESYTNDRSSLQLLVDRLTKLSLSYKKSKDQEILEYICSQIYQWFIDEDTKMNPNLNFAQTRRGISKTNSYGIIDFKDIYYFLAAIKLIEKDIINHNKSIYDQFTYWLIEYKMWLSNSESGKKESCSANNHGTCYLLQKGSIEGFINNKDQLFNIYITANLLILNSIDNEGKQHNELDRTLSKHYATFNLQQFINLNYLLNNSIKQSFFDNSCENNKLILAIKWLHKERHKWKYKQIEKMDEDRIDVLFHMAKNQSELIDKIIPNDSIKPIEKLKQNFEQGAGIPLYWKEMLN